MDEEYLERELSILIGRKSYQKTYSSASEFKNNLKEAALAQEKLRWGWVFWQDSKQKILTLLKHIASNWWLGYHYLVQFWAVVKVEGRHHYLSTSRQPFCVPYLKNELCWYRNLCIDHLYRVDMEEVAEEEQLGGVGRAYRNKHPESSPDLRLYSTNEFPLRDQAARCRLIAYLALPLFHLHNNRCYGVLELLSHVSSSTMNTKLLCTMDRGLQIAGLRSTHINFIPISRCTTEMPDKYKQQHEREITEIFELAIKAVPQLCLAQVWVPCKQCASISTNLPCMERASFINAQDKIVNLCKDVDTDIFDYLKACEFHNLQIDDLSFFRRNLCDLRISKNPLAHYAMRARLSSCFAIRVQNVKNSNKLYVIEFFLQPKCRKDAWDGSSLHFLLRIVEMKLKSFKFVSREQLPEELVVQSWQPNAIECESLDMLNVMTNSNEEIFTESNFTKYLETVHFCCLRPFSKESNIGWVFCRLTGNELSRKEIISDSLPVPIPIKNEVEHFMKKIAVKSREHDKWIVQFWVPKMAEDRCYLETSDQPYAVGCLEKGLASFRKECIKHHYFVDKETKEEELGPPGRVFRNGHPEITPDLFLYSTKEFLMRNYAVHCGLQGYCAFPVFEKLKSKCVGVLEFAGLTFYYELHLGGIGRALKEAKLHSIHSNFSPNFLAQQKPANIINSRMEALHEVRGAFGLIKKIPHLHMAKVWVPCDRCASVSGYSKCMVLVLTTQYIPIYIPINKVNWIHVEPKKGIIGMVLESESKSCFCQNLSEFSIVDDPLAHYQRRERVDVCFAICLHSSHTGDLLYVLEFFLNPSLDYLQSFFSFLLPIMKHQLLSFKMAFGKQLEEEFVVEVIKFSEANQLNPSESDLPDMFPIKFKSVQYSQKEHPFTTEQQEQSVPYATETEQCNVNASNLTTTKRGKRKTGLHLSLDDLKPHFGKKLNDVAEELGVGRSTIKRVCREHGIFRWPGNAKQARNLSLFKRENAQDPKKDTSAHHTNMENTRHQRLNSQDKYKDKRDEYGDDDDDDDDTVQIIDDNIASVGKDVALTTGYTNASLPGPLKMLRSYAEHDLNDGKGILIDLDDDVFGNKCKIYIHPEDIIPFCDLEPISGNCIVVYIWHLYKKINQENTIRRFQFVNPFAISYVQNSQPFARAYELANRLIATSSDQLVLVPCNIGKHWILTVIEPYKEVVSLLDPLNHCICDKWEHVVNIAMSIFNTNLKKDIIERPTWKIIKVPRQPDLKQCGFYVMRYMKEIVQGLNTIDSSSLSSLFVKEEYSQTDINEVRIEWAYCVQEHA